MMVCVRWRCPRRTQSGRFSSCVFESCSGDRASLLLLLRSFSPQLLSVYIGLVVVAQSNLAQEEGGEEAATLANWLLWSVLLSRMRDKECVSHASRFVLSNKRTKPLVRSASQQPASIIITKMAQDQSQVHNLAATIIIITITITIALATSASARFRLPQSTQSRPTNRPPVNAYTQLLLAHSHLNHL